MYVYLITLYVAIFGNYVVSYIRTGSWNRSWTCSVYI